ncbi:hypothetical protein ACHAXT_009735 [Thalassiosira profunda]
MDARGSKRKKGAAPEVADFYRLGKEMQNRVGSSIGAFSSEDRRFREFFGCGAAIALVLWNRLLEHDALPDGGMIMHLLWALHFMNAYPKQDAGSATAGGSGGALDPKTWRKYLWPFVEAIAYLEQFVVVFENRKVHRRNYNDCLLSVDGVDCKIPNHGPAFASHKFAGKSALRYELAIDIEKGDLSWIHGPFPAGNWPDINIFRHALKWQLDEYERVEADDGYRGDVKIKCPGNFTNPAENLRMQGLVRSRHETFNGRMKQWDILSVQYRHDLSTHGTVFRAIAVITQLSIHNGEPLFPVEYKDP